MFATALPQIEDVSCIGSPSVVDALLDPIGTAAWCATAEPGPDAVACLAALNPDDLGRSGRLDALAGLDRQLAWLTALRIRTLASITAHAPEAADPVDKTGMLWTVDEVRQTLHTSTMKATRLLHEADRYTTALAPTLRLLEHGDLSPTHAWIVADRTEHLTADQAATVQAKILPRAIGKTPAELGRATTRAAMAAAPTQVEVDHATALDERRVCLTARDDGMAELWAFLPADTAAAFMTALTAMAGDYCPTDGRTIDQRRADAVADLSATALADPALPKRHRVTPTIQVTVALTTLTGDDQQPADLAGHGPIPAGLARRIAADPNSTWRRLIVDAVGGLINYGRSTYRPPKDVTDTVLARDRTCTNPGCPRDAHHCDIDHRTEWQHGGETNESNLHAVCGKHHAGKTEGTLTAERLVNGGTRWTYPTGHTFTNRPEPYPVPTPPTPPARYPERPPF